ncbi:MAG TPA: hypothetical protein VJN18_32485 [Polyangiaceae bacterium]|nr:hypothetical protein [Polyangiaceae bacterium]
MKPAELVEAVTHDCCPIEPVREMARRDWAVRVLDAWAVDGERAVPQIQYDRRRGVRSIFIWVGDERKEVNATTIDAARLAAAEAVWAELPESVRAELGERP